MPNCGPLARAGAAGHPLVGREDLRLGSQSGIRRSISANITRISRRARCAARQTTRAAAPTRLTLVNGVPTFDHGAPTGRYPGQFVAPGAAIE